MKTWTHTTATIIALAVLLVTAACTARYSIQPAQLSPTHGPDRVWVTRADDSTFAVDQPRVRGDSLFGIVGGTPEHIPLIDVAGLREERVSPSRTAGLVVALGGVAAAFTYYVVTYDTGGRRVCNLLCPINNPACCIG
jgi:hypothetical protein